MHEHLTLYAREASVAPGTPFKRCLWKPSVTVRCGAASFPKFHLIGIGAEVTRRPLPHHGAYGSAHGGRVGCADGSNKEGKPSEAKYAFETPTDKAFAFASYQGPSLLAAVLLASLGRTPSSSRAALRRPGVFHCRHTAALSRNRIQRVRMRARKRDGCYEDKVPILKSCPSHGMRSI